MNNLLISLNVVAPLFLLMLLGFGMRRLSWLGAQTVAQMNRITFRVFLPTMLFINISTCDLQQDFHLPTILAAVGMSLFSALLAAFIAFLLEKDPARRASMAQGMFRNNYILFGIPIMTAVYGPSSTGYISMLLAFIIPLNNVLAVIEMQVIAGKSRSAGAVVKGVVTNPFVIAAVLGFVFLLCGIELPAAVSKAVNNVGSIANPLSLILLGASLEFGGIKGYARDILVGCGVKLILLPLLFVTILAACGVRGERLLVLFIASATPAAVSTQIMAREMGGDGNLAGHLVVFGTAFSVLTLFFWIFILNALHLL